MVRGGSRDRGQPMKPSVTPRFSLRRQRRRRGVDAGSFSQSRKSDRANTGAAINGLLPTPGNRRSFKAVARANKKCPGRAKRDRAN